MGCIGQTVTRVGSPCCTTSRLCNARGSFSFCGGLDAFLYVCVRSTEYSVWIRITAYILRPLRGPAPTKRGERKGGELLRTKTRRTPKNLDDHARGRSHALCHLLCPSLSGTTPTEDREIFHRSKTFHPRSLSCIVNLCLTFGGKTEQGDDNLPVPSRPVDRHSVDSCAVSPGNARLQATWTWRVSIRNKTLTI